MRSGNQINHVFFTLSLCPRERYLMVDPKIILKMPKLLQARRAG